MKKLILKTQTNQLAIALIQAPQLDHKKYILSEFLRSRETQPNTMYCEAQCGTDHYFQLKPILAIYKKLQSATYKEYCNPDRKIYRHNYQDS